MPKQIGNKSYIKSQNMLKLLNNQNNIQNIIIFCQISLFASQTSLGPDGFGLIWSPAALNFRNNQKTLQINCESRRISPPMLPCTTPHWIEKKQNIRESIIKARLAEISYRQERQLKGLKKCGRCEVCSYIKEGQIVETL